MVAGRLPEMVEGSLHLVQMRVLSSTHAFVFGAQKRSFIGLPRLQNGQLLCRPYVVRFDDIHGGFEDTRGAHFRLVHISMISRTISSCGALISPSGDGPAGHPIVRLDQYLGVGSLGGNPIFLRHA